MENHLRRTGRAGLRAAKIAGAAGSVGWHSLGGRQSSLRAFLPRRLLAFLVLIFAVVPLRAQELTLRDLAGDWMDVRYAEALAKTRSPLAAEKSGATPTSFWLRQENGKWRLFATDFHEGFGRVVSGIVRVAPGTYDLLAGNPEAESGSGHRIRITVEGSGDAMHVHGAFFEEGKPFTYRRLGATVEHWAAKILLAGDYRDEHGASVSFGADGVASIDGKRFKYTPILDTSEACCDYVNTDRKPRSRYQDRIAYQWRGDVLELFDVIIDPDGECPIAAAKKSFAVLRRR